MEKAARLLLAALGLSLARGSPEGGTVSLLQVGMGLPASGREASAGMPLRSRPQHYWPMARGRPHHYAQTSYGLPAQTLNLTDALAWRWELPKGINSLIWGTLIDSEANIYVASMGGIYKLSPNGQTIWQNPNVETHMPSLMGDALYGMTYLSGEMFAIDIETGATRWRRKVANSTGLEGDMVQAYGGVVITGVEMYGVDPSGGEAAVREQVERSIGGRGATRVIAVNASNGEELWRYDPECWLWNIMALFPDNETTAFMDCCGGVYRFGLYTGELLWNTSGSVLSFTDGGPILGPDGSIYTCSSPLNNWGQKGTGLVRKYRLSDGKRLWETELTSPCVNFPAVSGDGGSLIVGEGALADPPKTLELKGTGMTEQARSEFYSLQSEMMRSNEQRAYYHMPDLNASILALDTRTGALQWRHEVPPYGGVAFAMDEERAWNSLHGNVSAYCWPSHWGGVTVDDEGTVYIGRSTGSFYVYKPKQDLEFKFRTNDGFLMAGVSFAPGMMVVPTCSFVHVFKY